MVFRFFLVKKGRKNVKGMHLDTSRFLIKGEGSGPETQNVTKTFA